MAAASKVMCRLSSRLQPLAHTKLTKPSLSLKLNLSPSAPRLSPTSRLPVELSSWESMMPLHSAVASARLVSSLSIESYGWGLVPQGAFSLFDFWVCGITITYVTWNWINYSWYSLW